MDLHFKNHDLELSNNRYYKCKNCNVELIYFNNQNIWVKDSWLFTNKVDVNYLNPEPFNLSCEEYIIKNIIE